MFKNAFFILLTIPLLLGFQNCGQLESDSVNSLQGGIDSPGGDTGSDNGGGSGEEPTTPGTDNRCIKSENLSDVEKPRGVYTSMITDKAVLNPTIRGGLIREPWSKIERNPGEFCFANIDAAIAKLPEGASWSLVIHGGWSSVDQNDPDFSYTNQNEKEDLCDPNYDPRNPSKKPAIALEMSPSWLVDQFGVETFEMEFRKIKVNMPKYWDVNLQNRLAVMMQKVAERYKDDPRLKLVYVPQMTSNGVEGHFNGVPHDTLLSAAGIDPSSSTAIDDFKDVWVDAALNTTLTVSSSFPNKAVAYEVHELLDDASIPEAIIENFLIDPRYGNRVGAAMWWISGDNDYQPALVEILKNYQGDLYGQVIGKSETPERFGDSNYASVFTQAKEMCMRYIEPWNYEFDNNTYNDLMTDFNSFADSHFD